MVKRTLYVDGKYIKLDTKTIQIFTPGVVKYFGVFETMRVLGSRVDHIDEHLQRMLLGLKALRIKHTFTKAQLKHIVTNVVRKNSLLKSGRLRLLVFKEGRQVHCVGMVLPYRPLSVRQYQRGLKTIIMKTGIKANKDLTNVKSLDYGVFAQALQTARDKGFDEALLLNTKGHIIETSRGNVFVCLSDQWITPPLTSGCLNGIMRAHVIKVARELGVNVEERNITVKMFLKAQAAFMTNSLMGIMRIK